MSQCDNCRATVKCVCDTRKRHTGLNVLVCCLTRVRKRAFHNDLKDHGRVLCIAAEPSSFCHCVTVCKASIIQLCYHSAFEKFCASNFHRWTGELDWQTGLKIIFMLSNESSPSFGDIATFLHRLQQEYLITR